MQQQTEDFLALFVAFLALFCLRTFEHHRVDGFKMARVCRQ